MHGKSFRKEAKDGQMGQDGEARKQNFLGYRLKSLQEVDSGNVY